MRYLWLKNSVRKSIKLNKNRLRNYEVRIKGEKAK
jgi:hypothetical protein